MAKFQAKDVDSFLASQYSGGPKDVSKTRPVTPKVDYGGAQRQSQILQQQSQKDIETLNDIIAERDAELKKVFLEAKEVNQLFHSVATMVNDQGAMVDDISSNITHANRDVKRGVDEVKQADEEDKSNALPWVIGGVSVVGVVGAVVGAVFLL